MKGEANLEQQPYLRKVQFYETDGMNIVYHGNYVHWMEEARVYFMEQMGYGYDKVVNSGIDIALTDISCHYKSMTRFGDTVRIYTSITALSPARMALAYRMEDSATGELRFLGESRHFFCDRRTGGPVALKRVLPELYQQFGELVEKEQPCESKK